MIETHENPGCIASILRLFGIQPRSANQETDKFPYRVRDDFLSPAEHSFYLVLKGLLGDRFTICTKVSLADVFFVVHPEENLSAYNRINRKHVDFLMCDLSTMKPCFAIELDDKSHTRRDREERDEFVDGVFEAAGLPLFHIPAAGSYSTTALNEMLELATHPMPSMKSSEEPNRSPTEAPICPKCGTKMVLRIARTGRQAGKKFYGCPNFPKCRAIISFPD
jgi:predicted RNA-binding Zn-ribbon protein involved in translation (DUF1610 family)